MERALRVMVSTCEETWAMKKRSNKIDYHSVYQKYKKVLIGVGSLSAQHLIAVSAMVGLLPLEYALKACIAAGTNTANKLYKKCGISLASAEKLKNHFCQKYGYEEKEVEN